jgi:hypothetical protein
MQERISNDLWGMTPLQPFAPAASARLCNACWGAACLAGLFLGLVCHTSARGQNAPFLPLPPDHPSISGVVLHPIGQPVAPPCVPLQDEGGPQLRLRFDDLTDQWVPWEVRVVHCDRHWHPSDLHPSEYIQGFYTTPVEEVEGSFGTKTDFAHHTLTLPNDDLRWTRSGNYLLEVVDPDAPDTPVLVRRFVVYEERCAVDATTGEPQDIALRRTHQEVHFTVTETVHPLVDPYDRLCVTVVPNRRWDRAITGLPPRFVKGSELDFQRSGYVFEGGNTFRFVDLKGLEYAARGVARLEEHPDAWHAHLDTDERRTYDYYGDGQDIHGGMVLHNDRLDPYTGSDHVWVHWTLDTKYPLLDQRIFLVGEFSQHQCLPDFELTYDGERGRYVHSHRLKQGYYNYHYVVQDVSDGGRGPGRLADVEGSHFQTNNLYTLLVHHWDDYDRVVGFAQWESNP